MFIELGELFPELGEMFHNPSLRSINVLVAPLSQLTDSKRTKLLPN